MKIAFVHNDPRYVSGTNYINKLIEKKLIAKSIDTVPVYPDPEIFFHDFPKDLAGTLEILVFFSACRDKEKVMGCDAVFGTTYSTVAYLGYSKKVISHFGSTMKGMGEALAADAGRSDSWVWKELIDEKAIDTADFDPSKNRFLNDIAEIEAYVARKAAIVIAASAKVKNELVGQGVPADKIIKIHNGIEDFWFADNGASGSGCSGFGVCSFGRIGGRVKDLMIKGVDRLAEAYNDLEDIKKTSILLSGNERACQWMNKRFKNHAVFYNLSKEDVQKTVSGLRGHALLITSRYEGFSLPLIEGMSQGLIPVGYDVGAVSEVVENGKNGFVVSSVEEMVSRVRQLSKDENARVAMSESAIATSRKFTADSMADKIVGLLETA